MSVRVVLSPKARFSRIRFRTGLGWLLTFWLTLISARAEPVAFSFPQFTNSGGLLLHGTALVRSNQLELGVTREFRAAGAWFPSRAFVEPGFTSTFAFQISPGVNEGFAFVIQNNPALAVGEGGKGLGYEGIANSVAIEFDARRNTEHLDLPAPHVSIHTRGAYANSASQAASLASAPAGIFDFGDGAVHMVTIQYRPGRLNVFLDNTNVPRLELRCDLGKLINLDQGQAWVGFTADSALARVLNWTFTPVPQSVSVALTSPANNSVYAFGAPISPGAQVSATGTVARVEFFDGPLLLATDGAAPFAFNWTNALPGMHTLMAVVYAADGKRSVSTPVNITVSPLQPPIGINFARGNGGTNYSLGPSQLAGVTPQAQWNNLVPGIAGTGNGNASNLRDGNGNFTPAAVEFRFNSPGEEPGVTAGLTADHQLMRAYLANLSFFVGQTSSYVRVTQIPFSAYDVIVYSDGDNRQFERVSEFRIGEESIFVRDQAYATFAGHYAEARGTANLGLSTTAGNYVRFCGLTNNNFTLDIFERSFQDVPRRAAVNGIQIIPAAAASPTPPILRVVRGPYLQSGAATAMTICWRTDRATNALVRYGTTPANLNLTIADAAITNDHAVRLSGLTPDTRYYYALGAAGTNFTASAEHYFTTSPTQARPVRLWVMADAGTADYGAASVRDAFLNHTGDRRPDLMIALGDNAYNNGSDSEYQAAFFDMFRTVLGQTVLWSAMGNHETYTPGLPYLHMFHFPTAGEAGGIPSGSELYYSFNYANIHFVCLESTTEDRSPQGPMLTWLRADLAANTNQWLIVYVHAPPHSKGSHNSDDPVEIEMQGVRENMLPILEEYGVDLLLSGNSHGYERSLMMDGFYGLSDTFGPQFIKQSGTGRSDDTGAYVKAGAGVVPHSGTISVVAGNAGRIHSDFGLDHPVMVRGLRRLGSLLIDVNGSELHARLICSDGTVGDYFSLRKEVPTNMVSQVSVAARVSTLNESSQPTSMFEITRVGPTNEALKVFYRVSGGAENGRDYARLAQSLTIPAGQHTVFVPIATMDDQAVEGAESVRLDLQTNTAPFRLVVIPDTRAYIAQSSGATGLMLDAQIRWVTAQADALNIAGVLHTGDITEHNSAAEWTLAQSLLRLPVPFALVPGDRDGLAGPVAQTDLFNTYFPYSEARTRPDFGDVFQTNRMDNCYHYFSAGGIDWLVLALEFIPRDEVLAWANRVVATHPERKVIVLTHAFVAEDDTWPLLSQYDRENTPLQMWEKFLRRHANIAFVISGHTEGDGLGRRIDVGDYGNKVVQLAANFSGQLNGGNGYLRILEFDPAQDRLRVQTFSPYLTAAKTDLENQFDVPDLGLFKPWHGRYAIHSVSNTATITIQDNDVDNTRPALLSARAVGPANQIVLVFSEPLDEVSAETAGNYAIAGFAITAATLLPDGVTVVLTVAGALQDGANYSLSVAQVGDRATPPNRVLPSTNVSFTHRLALLFDDFNDRNFTGWQIVDEGTVNAPSIWSAPAGKLDQSSSIHGPDDFATENRQGTYAYWAAPAALGWSGYILRATVRTPDDDALGLMFWFQDSANYFKLELDRRNSFHKLLAVTSGFEILLAEESGTFPLNTDLQLSVEAVDDRIYATLNGQPMFGGIVTNASAGIGTVGLYCWNNAGVTFDNVEVVPAPPNDSPSVALTAPANDTAFLAPANLLLSATASDADGIQEVEFFAGQELLGITTQGPPFTLVWSNVPPGEYVLTAIAKDHRGFSAMSAPVEIHALLLDQNFDSGAFAGWTIRDEGTLDFPSAWQVSGGKLTQSANIFGPNSAAVTERLGTFAFRNDPATFRWRDYELSATLSSGDDDGIGLLFRFRDADNYYKLEFDAQRNFRKLLRKLNGVETTLASESGSFTLNTPFVVNVLVIGDQIEVRVDNTLLFGGPVTDSTLKLGTIGVYTWGNPAAAFDNIRVAALSPPDQPPLISILSPTNQAIFTPPANITFFADANDPDGAVQAVDFLAGETLLGRVTTRPFIYTWQNVEVGVYTIQARAVDDLGAESFTPPLQISVDFPPGSFALRGPRLITPNLFEFRVEAPLGTPLIIETSPDLQQWTPFATLTNTAAPFQFSHPTTHSRHFYRARQQ